MQNTTTYGGASSNPNLEQIVQDLSDQNMVPAERNGELIWVPAFPAEKTLHVRVVEV